MQRRCGCRFATSVAEQPRRAADVAQRLELREIELLGERFEVDPREPRHAAQELLERRLLFVERLEDPLLSVLGLVLRLAGPQRFGKVVPELEEPRVQHLENAADVARAPAVEVQRARRRVRVGRAGPVALPVEDLHRDQGVEEIRDPARVHFQLAAQGLARQGAIAECGEDPHLDRGEQHLRRPEAECGLENRAGIELSLGFLHRSTLTATTASACVSASTSDVKVTTRCGADPWGRGRWAMSTAGAASGVPRPHSH